MTAEARLVTALRDYRPLLTPEVVLACEASLAEISELLREERRVAPEILKRLALLVDPLTSPLAGSDPARAVEETSEILAGLR